MKKFGKSYNKRGLDSNPVYQLEGAGGGANVTTSEVSPDDPSDGDLWFNETKGELYVYIDGIGWVQTNGIPCEGMGTVTSVSGSGGISGTVTDSGSLSLSNSGVTAGTYTNATVAVDSKGRVTSASSGSSGSGIKVIAKGIATSSGFSGNNWQFSSMTGCTGTSLNISSFGSRFRITLNTANSGAVVNLMPSTPSMSVSGRSYEFYFGGTASGSYHFIAVG